MFITKTNRVEPLHLHQPGSIRQSLYLFISQVLSGRVFRSSLPGPIKRSPHTFITRPKRAEHQNLGNDTISAKYNGFSQTKLHTQVDRYPKYLLTCFSNFSHLFTSTKLTSKLFFFINLIRSIQFNDNL